MIQPLRAAHRRAFVVLAIALPAVFWAGIRAREPPLGQSSVTVAMPSHMYLLRQSDRLWGKHSIQSMFYGDSTNGEEIDVLFVPPQEMNDPDLLLYWTGDLRPAADISRWTLLGAFTPQRVFPSLSMPGVVAIWRCIAWLIRNLSIPRWWRNCHECAIRSN